MERQEFRHIALGFFNKEFEGENEEEAKILADRLTNYYFKETKESLEYRKYRFAEELKTHIDDVGREELLRFYSYWTEVSPNGRKMRWEKQKTFDIPRRLATWKRNQKKFNSINLAKRIIK